MLRHPGLLIAVNLGEKVPAEVWQHRYRACFLELSATPKLATEACLVAIFAAAKRGTGFVHDSNTIGVAFEGYLSDCLKQRGFADRSNPAALIAQLYVEAGENFAIDLRGSYAVAAIDRQRRRISVITDRRASRSLFQTQLPDGTLLIAPEVQTLAQLRYPDLKLREDALAQFLIRGGYYGQTTLFDDIHKIPHATIVTIANGTYEERPYWKLVCETRAARSDAELFEEADALLLQAARRLLAVTRRPVLSLSGGLDSRVTLAYLKRAGLDQIDTIAYGHRDIPGGDIERARQLASYADAKLAVFVLSNRDFAHHAAFSVISTGIALFDNLTIDYLLKQCNGD